MNWKDILKSDPCTMETKEMLYNTLQKLGANNELLDEIKNTQIDDLREMIEELIITTKHPTQVKIFKQILRNWDICIVESQRNPIQQVNMGGSNKDFPVGFDVKNAMDLLKFSPDSHSGPMVLPHFLTEVFDIPLKHSRQKLEEIPHNIRAALTRFLSHRDGVINMLTEEEFVSVHRIITQPYNRMGMYPGIVPGLHKLLQILKKHAETRDMDKEEEEWN